MTGNIGEGHVHLVVGASGAGKDTLIARARIALAGNPRFVFPRRIVTRPSSAWEDHDTLDRDAFMQAARRGDFALVWEAHGLAYGLPRSIDATVAAGLDVVCNVSRAIVAQARVRWRNVRVVLIDAPPQVLAQRLRERSRDSDTAARLARSTTLVASDADVVIENGGDLEIAVEAFLRAIA